MFFEEGDGIMRIKSFEVDTDAPLGVEKIGQRSVLLKSCYSSSTQSMTLVTRTVIEFQSIWTPQSWLKKGSWIAQSKDESWFGFDYKPDIQCEGWNAGGGTWFNIEKIQRVADLEFDPPPCERWQDSLREIV